MIRGPHNEKSKMGRARRCSAERRACVKPELGRWWRTVHVKCPGRSPASVPVPAVFAIARAGLSRPHSCSLHTLLILYPDTGQRWAKTQNVFCPHARRSMDDSHGGSTARLNRALSDPSQPSPLALHQTTQLCMDVASCSLLPSLLC